VLVACRWPIAGSRGDRHRESITAIYFNGRRDLTMAVDPSQPTGYINPAIELDLAIALLVDATCCQAGLGTETSLLPFEYPSKGIVMEVGTEIFLRRVSHRKSLSSKLLINGYLSYQWPAKRASFCVLLKSNFSGLNTSSAVM